MIKIGTGTWPGPAAPPSAAQLERVVAAVREAAPAASEIEVTADPLSGSPVLRGDPLPLGDLVDLGHRAASVFAGRPGGQPDRDVVIDIAVAESETPADGAPPADESHAPPGDITDPIPDQTGVLVVGAGIMGLSVARALTANGFEVAVIDAGARVASHTTSWNNGMIHPGHDPLPGTVKARLNVAGNAQWADWASQLDIRFERTGSLVVAFADDVDRLSETHRRAVANGVPGARLISGDDARELEPRISQSVVAALLTPTAASIEPVECCDALVRELRRAGVPVSLNARAEEIVVEDGRVAGVSVSCRSVEARLVINAAGVRADLLSATAGSRRYSIHPRRGTLIIVEPSEPYLTSVGAVPGRYSKGGGLTARPRGRTTAGPTAVEQQPRAPLPPSEEEIAHIRELAVRLVPGFVFDRIVESRAEVRAATYNEDFVIGPAPGVVGLIDVAGTQSPAVASAPAIAELVADQLDRLGWTPSNSR